MNSEEALGHPWLAEDAARLKTRKINTKNLKRFMARRKWQVCIYRGKYVTCSGLGLLFFEKKMKIVVFSVKYSILTF